MGSQWSKDSAYLRAMREGYRSRAAYKLIEIQNRYHIIRETDNVVDLGAAPGSWLQVIRATTKGKVLGIDLSPVADHVRFAVGVVSRLVGYPHRAIAGPVNSPSPGGRHRTPACSPSPRGHLSERRGVK